MQKPKFTKLFLLLIVPLTLLAVSCGKDTNNTLDRPVSQTNPEDSGEVAGADIVQLPTKTIVVGSQEVEVELATTDEHMAKGLSGREKLDDGKGMLFDFSASDFNQPGFWMKDMLISIDIIWIDAIGKVIGVEANVPLPPEDADLPVYYPPAPISYVLEVPAGWSEKNNITVGSTVTF